MKKNFKSKMLIILLIILNSNITTYCHISSSSSSSSASTAQRAPTYQPQQNNNNYSQQQQAQQSFTYNKDQGLTDNIEDYGIQQFSSFLDKTTTQQNNPQQNNPQQNNSQQNNTKGQWTAGQQTINYGNKTYTLDPQSGLYKRNDTGEKYALDLKDQRLISIEDGKHTVRNALISIAGGTALGAAGTMAYGKYKQNSAAKKAKLKAEEAKIIEKQKN